LLIGRVLLFIGGLSMFCLKRFFNRLTAALDFGFFK